TVPAGGGDERKDLAGADPLQLARTATLVRRAHEWLVEHQNPDGSFSVLRSQSAKSAPVAVTALAALSLMAAGNLPDRPLEARDRVDNVVKRAIDWLIAHNRPDGAEAGYFYDDGDTISKMHGQGYATLALTQAVGMYGD